MSAQPEFIHLRVHSAYSLSEGAVRLDDLAEMCRKLTMPAVAITDTNNLFGAMEFSGKLSGAGIQPVIGCQLRVHISSQDAGSKIEFEGSFVFLVQNQTGYLNLLKLLSIAYMDTDESLEPHVTVANMAEYNTGLIALSGGPGGLLGDMLLKGNKQLASELASELKGIYGDRIYLEIMRHGTEHERNTEQAFLDFAYDLDIALVATNEVFFPTRDMYEAHDALICIAAGRRVSEVERRRLTPEHYFKTAREMKSLFKDLPEAVDNTVIIAKRCSFMVPRIDPILPPYDCGEGCSETDELRAQSERGLDGRLADHVYRDEMDEEARKQAAQPYRERLDYELSVIHDMGFPGYFLIVADFIGWSNEQGIPVGPGRGSGAGSVVAWALTITDLDPLRWGLLFERFLNPERVSMPDFDIDFCQDRRDEVIRYVQGKYGRDRVAQIITFGKLQARAVLRDVGRVLDMSYGKVNDICKMIPNNPADPVDLNGAINGEPELRRLIREDNEVSRLVTIAKQLEGLNRHASTHAAGVVIGDRPLDRLIPLYRDPRSDMPVTGFNMKFVESAGLVKFDFLGLKTLTVLAKAQDLVRQRPGCGDIDVSKIPLDDRATFEMISEGHTVGVFQLESAGMVDVLRKLKPDVFEVIIAVVALYRPGPMDNIPSFIRRKDGTEKIDYLYPTLEGILSETFGVIIYQEQVMQIAQELSGYSLGKADLLRRAMGKKDKAGMDEQRLAFVNGAKAKGVKEQRASEIFDLVGKFAGYGFNKSHAAAYAMVAYQTAYMKANYPVEFLAASMTLDLGNTDKLNIFRQELDRLGIALLKPDINRSQAVFSVEPHDKTEKLSIRYALGAIKNVGSAAMEALIGERRENGPFKDLGDFINRLGDTHVNKRQMENLIRAGGLDCFGYNRKELFGSIEMIMRHAHLALHERNDNQMGLFGGEAAPVQEIDIPQHTEWDPMDRLKEEFDAIGFYLSGHPLDAFGSLLKGLRARPIKEIMDAGKDCAISMAGTVIAKKERISAKGNRYAFISLSDSSGSCEVTAFSDALAQARDYLEIGQNIFIKGGVKFEDETPRFTGNTIESLDNKAANTVCSMRVVIAQQNAIDVISQILEREGKGNSTVEVMIRIQDGNQQGNGERDVIVRLKRRYAISPAVMQAVRSERGILDVQEI